MWSDNNHYQYTVLFKVKGNLLKWKILTWREIENQKRGTEASRYIIALHNLENYFYLTH